MYVKGRGVPIDFAEAIKWYRKAAEQGDSRAQTNLGYMYNKGFGVPQDFTEAAKWYRKADEQGGPDALFYRGVYNEDLGVPRDYVEAAKWYHKAAEQGVPSVQYYLGIMYYKGKDFLQDSVQAHMWLNLAASQGHKKAREYRDKIAVDMTTAQIAEAMVLAQKWFKEHQGGDGND
jgi:TPR repeat protein